jgi:outer membrane lipoprotein-sorting protein
MGSLLRYAFVGAAVLALNAASAAPLKSLHAKSRVTQTRAGQKPTVEVAETWVKNGKMRMKMGNLVRIMDGRDQIMFQTDDPQRRLAVSSLPPELQNASTSALLSLMTGAPPQWKRKKVGSQTILKYPAAIYQVSGPNANQTIKIWITTQPGGPIPLKQTMSDPSGSIASEVTSLEINPALSDSLFKAPAGYKKIAMPSKAAPGSKPKAPGSGKK